MKKLFLIILAVFALKGSVYGQKFEWNKSYEGGLGYTHVYESFGGDRYGTNMPTELIHAYVSLSGIYFSGGFWIKNTGHSVYGYAEQVSTFDFQLGPSWRIKWDDSKLTLTPYIGWLFYTVDDSSNNSIGQRQDYGIGGGKFVFGGRIGFAYKQFSISGFGSNKECGLSIGINLDYD